jgi:lipopolysaccharide transport system permease protein
MLKKYSKNKINNFLAQRNSIRHFYELLWGMTKRELVARYKNTFFGFLWVVINPLMQMAVIGFIFKFFINEPVKNYYLYLLIGLLVWNFFSISLSKATPSVVNERNLIKKAKFPREVIPISIILSNFTHLIIAFTLLLMPVIASGVFHLGNLIRFFEGGLLLLSFSMGLTLFTSALNVRFRDVNFFVQAILTIWFYATPIIYSIEVIPTHLIWIWRLNPMTSVVQLFQNAFISAPAPGPAMLLSNSAISIFMLIYGAWIFKKESRDFDDWV